MASYGSINRSARPLLKELPVPLFWLSRNEKGIGVHTNDIKP
jgi:hypothetical protein